MSIRFTSTGAKLLASTALIAAAAGAAGLATFGSFTSTTSASAQVNSGTVSINLGTAGTAANRLTVAASNIVPGDTMQRAVTLTNSGNAGLATLSLTTAATTSSMLDTQTTDGLQMVIDDCPTAWTEAGTAPAYTYTCTGGATTVVASRAVIGANIPLTGLSALGAGGSDNLRVTLTFPSTAGNNMQNQSSVIGFTFTGTQRGGTNK
jgi:hypothetical protein